MFHAYSAELAGELQASLLHWARLRSFERWITLAETNEWANMGVWMREATDLQSKEVLFHIACEMGLHTCIAPLIENGVDPLFKDRDEARGPLVAAANGHDTVSLELLDHGLAMETVWSCAVRNVLHEAVFGGHLQVVRLLIRRGIDLKLWAGVRKQQLMLQRLETMSPSSERYSMPELWSTAELLTEALLCTQRPTKVQLTWLRR